MAENTNQKKDYGCLWIIIVFLLLMVVTKACDYHDEKEKEKFESSFNVGITLFNQHDFKGALVQFKKAEPYDEYPHELYLKIAQCDMNIRQYKDAIVFYDKYLKYHKNDIDVAINKGNAYVSQKDYATALKVYDDILSLHANPDAELINEGINKLNSGDTKDAVELFEKVIENIYCRTRVENNKGLIQQFNNHYNEALKFYQKAILIDNRFDKICNLVLQYYYDNDNLSKVIELKGRLNSLKSKRYIAFSNYVNIYFIKKLPEQAINEAHNIYNSNKDEKLSFKFLGDVFLTARKFDSSIVFYKKVLEIDPTQDFTRRELGFAYKGNKNFREALNICQDLVNKYPNYDQAHADMAFVYMDMNKNDSAIDCFNHAISINSQIPLYYCGLGDCYLKKNDKVSAKKYFIKASDMGCVEAQKKIKNGFK